jgi:hypothetical protein
MVNEFNSFDITCATSPSCPTSPKRLTTRGGTEGVWCSINGGNVQIILGGRLELAGPLRLLGKDVRRTSWGLREAGGILFFQIGLHCIVILNIIVPFFQVFHISIIGRYTIIIARDLSISLKDQEKNAPKRLPMQI